MSINQLEQDVRTIRNARTVFTIMSVVTWTATAVLFSSVGKFMAILLIAAALTSCVMPVASHFAYKQRKSELEKIS